jgi:hypothetical protein
MRIEAITDEPQKLVNAINKAIEDGDLKTWTKLVSNNDETLYSHTPEQWNEKAMPIVHIHEDKVKFIMTWWTNNEEPPEATKGYILGRFTEVLLVHFKNHFTHLETFVK